jgi:hypothetical protein
MIALGDERLPALSPQTRQKSILRVPFAYGILVDFVRFQLHTTHIDQVTTQLGLVPRQCSITFRIL